LKLPARGQVRRQTVAAAKAIDGVHGDGQLEEFPVKALRSSRGVAGVTRISIGGRISGVDINPSGPWPELTVCHELGHVLDHVVFGGGRELGSTVAGGQLTDVMQAIGRSAAVKRLRDSAATADLPDVMRKRISNYLLYAPELWARAYAQYVASKTDDVALRKQLAKRLEAKGAEQWEADDFAPIATAIDDLFASLGWISK
jgi:hypothetical protein